MKKLYFFIFSILLSTSFFGQCAFTYTVYPNVETCFGYCDGSASVNVTGGTGPFTYSWTPGTNTGPNVTGLCQGTYWCIVEESGCKDSMTFVIGGATSVLSLSVTPHNVSCNGSSNGSANSFISGGTGSYNYSWSIIPPETAPNVFNLPVGTVTLVATDVYGCADTITADIQEPPLIVITPVSSSSVSCFGENDGTALMSVTGGTPHMSGSPYSYLWSSSGETKISASALSIGTSSFVVTDSLNCKATATLTIEGPSTAVSANASQQAGCDGSATVAASGGTPGYTYLWSPGGFTTQNVTGLSAGGYTVVVTDNNSCTDSDALTIVISPSMTLTLTTSNISCPNDVDGTASVLVSGGTPGYTYSWSSTVQTASNITGLSFGNYTLKVTDASTCITTQTFSIGNVSPISLSLAVNHICGSGTGSSTVTASGGTPNYTYSWSNGATVAGISGLSPGSYSLLVTDSVGCVDSTDITILLSQDISVMGTFTPITCFGDSNAVISTTIIGGIPNFTYSWMPGGSTTSSISGLSAGSYSVTVTDSVGCIGTNTIVITAPSVLTITVSGVDASCNGCPNGTGSAVAGGGYGGYHYLWTPNVETNASVTGLTAGLYTVCVTDSLGCETCSSVTISEPPASIKQNTVGSKDLSVNPVPFGKTLLLQFDNNTSGDVELSLSNIIGEVVFIGKIHKGQFYSRSIDTSALQPGVYLISVGDNAGILLSRKIVKSLE